jgi:RNA polymerase subunit RPABC4/transcription elongation factor Spt4
MSQSNIIIKLKNDAEAVYAFPNKKKEFFIDLFNASPNYLPQAKIRIEGPPEVKMLVKSEWYGGVPAGRSKRRLYSIIPKAEGIFKFTAYLTSKTRPIIDIPFEVRVGNVAVAPELSKPLTTPSATKVMQKMNCPFCHELIDNDASFCPHCGSNIQQKLEQSKKDGKDTRFCTKCGTELPIDAKFCAKCGTKLK